MKNNSWPTRTVWNPISIAWLQYFCLAVALQLSISAPAFAQDFRTYPMSAFKNERAQAQAMYAAICSEPGLKTDYRQAKFNELNSLARHKSAPSAGPYINAVGNIYSSKDCALTQNSTKYDMVYFSQEIAAKFHRTAAEMGYPIAQSNFGMRLLKGEGIPVDTNLGLMYVVTAASSGNFGNAAIHLANFIMDKQEFQGTPDELADIKLMLDLSQEPGKIVSQSRYNKAFARYKSYGGR